MQAWLLHIEMFTVQFNLKLMFKNKPDLYTQVVGYLLMGKHNFILLESEGISTLSETTVDSRS